MRSSWAIARLPLAMPRKPTCAGRPNNSRRGACGNRWDYPAQVGSPRFEDRNQVMGDYVADNWRAYRTWGVSGISPWEYEMFWTPRPGVDRSRKQLAVDWDNLQRPGLSPDYLDQRVEQISTAFEFDDWNPTAAGKAVLRNNLPVLAYIAGEPAAFTSKDHNFRAGQTVEKQLILINNSRQTQTFDCDWSLQLPQPIVGHQQAVAETGQQARIPLRFELPAILAAGAYELRAVARFGNGEEQKDSFTIHVLVAPTPAKIAQKFALFDPIGETAALLKQLGVSLHDRRQRGVFPPKTPSSSASWRSALTAPRPISQQCAMG